MQRKKGIGVVQNMKETESQTKLSLKLQQEHKTRHGLRYHR